MANLNELMDVARHCPGYSPQQDSFIDAYKNNDISCETCKHFQEHQCELNLYDKIAAGLDQG